LCLRVHRFEEHRSRPGSPRSPDGGPPAGLGGPGSPGRLDLPAAAPEGTLPMPAALLRTGAVFLPRVRSRGLPDPVGVAPDAGGLKWGQRDALAPAAPRAIIADDRPVPDGAGSFPVPGAVAGRAGNDIFTRSGVTAAPEETVAAVAFRMQEHNV